MLVSVGTPASVVHQAGGRGDILLGKLGSQRRTSVRCEKRRAGKQKSGRRPPGWEAWAKILEGGRGGSGQSGWSGKLSPTETSELHSLGDR